MNWDADTIFAFVVLGLFILILLGDAVLSLLRKASRR